MTDSSSFSSLLALVDSHLSKCSVQGTQSDEGTNSGTPSLSGIQNGISNMRLSSSERLPIPNFGVGSSPIKDILHEQIANMLKAKEKREQEEKKKLEEEREERRQMELKKQSDMYVIDLVKALQEPYEIPTPSNKVLSTSSSLESLPMDGQDSKSDDKDIEELKEPDEPPLPCITDMSYILKQKIRRAKCSAFGKVLAARYRSLPAPYLMEKIVSDIVPFDFKTKSPCDLIQEKLRRPHVFNPEDDIVRILGLI